MFRLFVVHNSYIKLFLLSPIWFERPFTVSPPHCELTVAVVDQIVQVATLIIRCSSPMLLKQISNFVSLYFCYMFTYCWSPEWVLRVGASAWSPLLQKRFYFWEFRNQLSFCDEFLHVNCSIILDVDICGQCRTENHYSCTTTPICFDTTKLRSLQGALVVPFFQFVSRYGIWFW